MTDSAPLSPPDCNLNGFRWMPLDILALENSRFNAIASDREFRAAIRIWCRAWAQVPAGSLDNDDRALRGWAGYANDPDAWIASREVVLHGFVLCSDGRLYHPVISQKAAEAFEERKKYQEKRDADADRMREWRGRKRLRSGPVTRDVIATESDVARDNSITLHNVTTDVAAKTETETYNTPLAPRARGKRSVCKLPDEWSPRDEEKEVAFLDCKMTYSEFDDCVADFREWASTRGRRIEAGVTPNWDITFRTSLREFAKRIGAVYRKTSPQPYLNIKAKPRADIERPAWFVKLETRFEDSSVHADWKNIWSRMIPISDGNPIKLRAPTDALLRIASTNADMERFFYVVGRAVDVLPPEKSRGI